MAALAAGGPQSEFEVILALGSETEDRVGPSESGPHVPLVPRWLFRASRKAGRGRMPRVAQKFLLLQRLVAKRATRYLSRCNSGAARAVSFAPVGLSQVFRIARKSCRNERLDTTRAKEAPKGRDRVVSRTAEADPNSSAAPQF